MPFWALRRNHCAPGPAIVMKRFVLVTIGVLGICPASAATILAAPVGSQEQGAIIVSGTLQPGDDEIFSKRLMQFPKGIVVLQGDGGDLQAAIKIGTAIRLKNYATLVPSDSNCASACAVAWLGGAPRVMEDGSQIGFHAAYVALNGHTTEVGPANALLGAYLGKIGLPDRAVVYITEAPPDRMTWLSSADAEKMGIDVKRIAGPKAPVVASAKPEAPAIEAPIRNQQLHTHPKKQKKVEAKAKNNRYFVAWMMETFRRLGVQQSTKLRDNASRSR